MRGNIGDLEQGEDSAAGREILYWNIDEERNVYEADTACFETAGDLTEEWRQIMDNAGCRACNDKIIDKNVAF